MWRAMIYKELRELFGIAALATAALFLYSGSEMRWSMRPLFGPSRSVPFLGNDYYYYFALIASTFGVLVGFKQTAWELWQGTFLYLFHRPSSQRAFVFGKLVIGLGLYLVCSVLPPLCVAVWAAIPETHPSPFTWSMTLPMWELWLTLSLVYFGAFASGMIDGKWYGTRLLPLVAALVASLAVYFIPWWWLSVPLFAGSVIAFLAVIDNVTRTRDFS